MVRGLRIVEQGLGPARKGKESWKRTVWVLLCFFLLAGGLTASAAEEEPPVFVIYLHGDIDLGLPAYLQRALTQAEEAGAAGVILDINTFGGRVDAATELRDLILESPLPTTAYVRRGWSAGALVALAADNLIMAPGSSIGAAEPRVGDQPADEKTVSALRQEFAATAQAQGRDPELAEAMVDKGVEIPGVVARGELLTLSAQRAVELDLAQAVTDDLSLVPGEVGWPESYLVAEEPSLAERLARFFTNPVLSPILLTLGFTGLILELYSPGWGVPGSVGLISLGLYFGGHVVAGLAGWAVLGLFLLGVVLLGVEILAVPGFGLPGVTGIVAIIGSIMLAAPNLTLAVIYILVALAGTTVLLVWLIRYASRQSRWKRLILTDKLDKEHGYSAGAELSYLSGRQGVTVTPLRPAGIAEIEGQRLDVVSEAAFVAADREIEVLRVEGSRILVREATPATEEE